MLNALVLGIALTPMAYDFGPDQLQRYAMKVTFEGFIPILGGQEGKVEVSLGVRVEGEAPEGGKPRAASEIESSKIVFNGAELPLGLDAVQEFFPRTTIVLTPQGRILSTDAPNVSLPVRLPGLDIKRFPDISYLPVEFPEQGIEVGRTFTFTKSFGGSDVEYTCQPKRIDDRTVEMDVTLAQSYEVLENEAKEVVTREADAVARVKTQVSGSGTIVFNRNQGVLERATIRATAKSDVTDLQTKQESRRTLVTLLEVKREGSETSAQAGSTRGQQPGLVQRASNWARSAWTLAKLAGTKGTQLGPDWPGQLRAAFESWTKQGPASLWTWIERFARLVEGGYAQDRRTR